MTGRDRERRAFLRISPVRSFAKSDFAIPGLCSAFPVTRVSGENAFADAGPPNAADAAAVDAADAADTAEPAAAAAFALPLSPLT